MSASALGNREGQRRFTLPAFHGLTRGMAGATRADVFMRLPQPMQDQAWAEDVAQAAARTEQLWKESGDEC